MKKSILTLFLALPGFCAFAQDSTASTWQPTIGVSFEPVPVYNISGTDTGFINSLAISPIFTIRHKSGWGISYSPHILTGGPKPGIFMHSVTAGLEQYNKEKFDVTAEYSHYFFTNTDNGVPYSPLTNEIYAGLTYKEWWLRPRLTADIGFGTDTTQGASSTSAHDIGVAAGFSHDFSWEADPVNFDLVPSLLLNGGTNQYFSFLASNKYIGHSKKFFHYLKSGSVVTHGSGGKVTTSGGHGNSHSGSGGTTTTTTTTANEAFSFSNIELNLEVSAEIGSFTVRPTASLFFPIGSSAGEGLSGYWSVVAEYNF